MADIKVSLFFVGNQKEVIGSSVIFNRSKNDCKLFVKNNHPPVQICAKYILQVGKGGHRDFKSEIKWYFVRYKSIFLGKLQLQTGVIFYTPYYSKALQ